MSSDRVERDLAEFERFNGTTDPRIKRCEALPVVVRELSEGDLASFLAQKQQAVALGQAQPETLQEEVTEWADATHGRNPVTQILHLWEELGEAFEASTHRKVEEEIADASLILMHLASTVGVRLPEPQPFLADTIRSKFEICKTRTYKKRESDGVNHHVESDSKSDIESDKPK